MRARDTLKAALELETPFVMEKARTSRFAGQWELLKIAGSGKPEVLGRFASRNRCGRELEHIKFEWRLDKAGLELVKVGSKQEDLL
tara:strand:+ start:360 stop:617 length:258 start_codon:yes stop_codon:yes gene_type:complete